MGRYKKGDQVTYAGNQEVYTVIDYKQLPNCRSPKLTYYVLEDEQGNIHDCNQPYILRLHKRRFSEI